MFLKMDLYHNFWIIKSTISISKETDDMTQTYNTDICSSMNSGSMRDSELGGPGSIPQHGSHCVIEVGGMCKLMVVVTGERLVH